MSEASDFKLLDRKVIDILNKIPEKKGFFRAISHWVGFKKTTVEFNVEKRIDGKSKWRLSSLVKYAVSSISAYSTVPMQIVTFVFVIWALIDKISGRALEGMTTLIIITVFIGSVIMISLGIIGYYVARIYDEVKGRPKYIISSQCRSREKNELKQK